MYFYQFHIGDYRTSTGHLSNEEDLAYRRLIDMYYMTEKPIPIDLIPIARKIKSTVEIIERLISDKLLVKRDDGYHNRRCDDEISQYQKQVEFGKQGANKRWGGHREPIGCLLGAYREGNATLIPNHEPITMNHEPDISLSKDNSAETPLRLRVPYQKLQTMYNSTCIRLKQSQVLDDKTKRNMKKTFDMLRGSVQQIQELLESANKIDFLAFGKDTWKGADIEFVFRPDKARKILDGGYSNNEKRDTTDYDELNRKLGFTNVGK